jgi:hypothetical protein
MQAQACANRKRRDSVLNASAHFLPRRTRLAHMGMQSSHFAAYDASAQDMHREKRYRSIATRKGISSSRHLSNLVYHDKRPAMLGLGAPIRKLGLSSGRCNLASRFVGPE